MNICFYFQVHQPLRLLEYSFFQIGKNHFYENTSLNNSILDKIVDKCYLKTNNILLTLINKYQGKFKITFSISGIALEQFQKHRPEVIESFRALADTNCVEFLSETYYHSLSFLYDKVEFQEQVKKHDDLIQELFGQKPQIFRNTELIFNNELALYIENMGYTGILSEGVDRILKGRKPDHLYKASGSEIKCILRDYELSDDIAFRFSDKSFKDYPITAEKFVNKIISNRENAQTVNIFLDYETFGEHQSEENGIFKLLEEIPKKLLERTDIEFKTPSQLVIELPATDIYDASDYISWADTERDLSAWLSNSMQYEALGKIYELKSLVDETKNPEIKESWSKLQTSDHFYYMCTKYWADGDVHKYFSPFNSPYDAYIYYMNIISDLEITLKKALKIKK